jgi:hypothetical protein
MSDYLNRIHASVEGYEAFIARAAELVTPQRCCHHQAYPGEGYCMGEPRDYCETVFDAAYRAGVVPL